MFGQDVIRKSHTKFLGLHIDDKLTWKTHIQVVAGKVSRMIGILAKLKNDLTLHAMRTLYVSMIHPLLRYGLIFWGSASNCRLNRLVVSQKKAIRVINRAGYVDHSEPLFKKSFILKFEDLHKLEMCKFIFKDLCDCNEHFNFTPISSSHGYGTRNNLHLSLPQPRINILRNSVFFKGINLYNQLADSIKSAPSRFSFKSQLKKSYIRAYESF